MMLKILTQIYRNGYQEVIAKEYHLDVASVAQANILLKYVNDNAICFMPISLKLLV